MSAAGAAISLVAADPSVETVLQIRLVAEVTLALILFHDAARVRPRQLRGELRPVARILLLALPLTVLLGYAGVRIAFPDAAAMTALLLAASLAPTDAGLGASIMADPAVPARVRRLLNFESGLNDGLVTPVVLFCIARSPVPRDCDRGSVWRAPSSSCWVVSSSARSSV